MVPDPAPFCVDAMGAGAVPLQIVWLAAIVPAVGTDSTVMTTGGVFTDELQEAPSMVDTVVRRYQVVAISISGE